MTGKKWLAYDGETFDAITFRLLGCYHALQFRNSYVPSVACVTDHVTPSLLLLGVVGDLDCGGGGGRRSVGARMGERRETVVTELGWCGRCCVAD
jgi:hypothetical protein